MNELYDLELEQSVLSCTLIDPNTWSEMAVKPDDFYNHKNVFIAKAIESLFKARIDVDYVTVSRELENQNRLEEIGGDAYLTKIISRSPTSLNARSYADQLKTLAARRRILESANEIAKLAYDGEKSFTEITSEARQTIDNAISKTSLQAGRTMAEALSEFDQAIESRKGQDFNLLGISTNYQDIDHTLDGLQDGWLYLIAARPGNGKTAMLGNLALNVAKQGKQVLFFSAEMHDLRIIARMMTAESQIHADILKHAKMNSEDEWSRYYQAVENLEGLPMWLFSPDECRAVEKIESITRQRHALGEVDIIFVDYLQLLQLESTSRTMTREQEVTKITQTLKRITNLKIPVVAAAQLSRAVELRAESKPQLSDLRESGSLEQEADAVCFLYHPDDEVKNSLDFIVAKNRDGALGECPLYYDKTTQKIQTGIKRTVVLNPPKT